MELIFNSRDSEKLYEDLREYTETNKDGTITEITNREEIYHGFKIIERDEITKNQYGNIIKRQHRKFGVATTRSADRAFRRAGLKNIDIEDARAEMALLGAKDVLALGSN